MIAALLSILFFPRTVSVIPPANVVYAEVTMYNAVPAQTDKDPHITASGKRISKNTAACPERLAFGTRIMTQGKRYVCEDRMAKRYRQGDYFDLIAEDEKTARLFGRQKLYVAIDP